MSRRILEARTLRFAYPDGPNEALRGASLALSDGEKLAVIGANGSGKSTLLLLLAGAMATSRGEIFLHGAPVGKDLAQLRGAVGLVFQDPDDQLFMPLAVEDVAFGLVARGVPVGEAQARARDALADLGVAHLADRAPHRLSGGEARRVALAAILVMEPEVLALDEPTSSLDPRARRLLIQTLRDMDRPMIVATHDLDMARAVCGRTIVLHEGLVAAEGPTSELLGDAVLLDRCGL
ncbi:MAG: ABC transporter ATP-binding protein [Synergistaceae bacterium]|nr:ABC transporter ATP-binding protein [Synergistaceae bacterium]